MDTLHALNPKYSYPTLQHHQDPETRNLGLEDRTLDLNRHSPQLKLKHPKSFLLLLLWVKVTFLFGILSRQHFHKGIFWQELTCKIVARPSFPVVNATFLFLWHSFPQTFPPTQSLLAHLVLLLHIFCCWALNRVGLAGSWQPLGLVGPHGRRRLNAWTSWRHYGPTPPSISDSTQSIENVEKSFDDFGLASLLLTIGNQPESSTVQSSSIIAQEKIFC